MVTGEYPPMIGGIGDYTAGLVGALRSCGANVSVITDHAIEGYGVVASPGWRMRDLPGLRRTIRRLNPDVVHIQYQTAAFRLGGAISVLPSLVAAPVVTTFHDTREPYLFPKAGRLRRAANALLARSSRRVVCTNFEDAVTVRRYGARRISVVPLGNNVPSIAVKCRDRRALRARLGAVDDQPLIGHFGLIGETKGADDLAAAVVAIPGAQLAFIGATAGAVDPNNMSAATALKTRVRELGIADRVHWTGPVPLDDASRLLSVCDLVALPFRDGASFRRTTLIAALANGCAVITTAPSSPLSLRGGDDLPTLRHGVELWLVPASDPRQLSMSIRRLLGEPALRRRLGEQARAVAVAFSWPTVANRMMALYRQAAK
jgi:glycosyltransferase involved in cell wall biosynthesis